MKVGPEVQGDVYVLLDGEWTLRGPIDYPEGWYLVPPSFDSPE